MRKTDKGYIYCITSKENNLQYIGLHGAEEFDDNYFGSPISMNGLAGEYAKYWPANNNLGYKKPNKEEFKEHFTIEVIEWCENRDDLFEREKYWIKTLDTYNNGLNRNKGGKDNIFGPASIKFCVVCNEETKWKGEDCYACLHKNIRSIEFCKKCNEDTKHIRNICVSCMTQSNTFEKFCKSCKRITKHRINSCQKCTINKTLNTNFCKIHGKGYFSGKTCRKCISSKAQKLKYCNSCKKETNHNGDACRNCSAIESTKEKECIKHGWVLHKGNLCYTCNSRSSQSKKWCKVCQKEQSHRGDNCMSCSYKKIFSEKYCEFCKDIKKHRKEDCSTCNNRIIHKKHLEKIIWCKLCLK